MASLGVLSTINNPTLPFVLAAIHQQGLEDVVVLLDERTETEKDLRIWNERTGGAFERIEGVTLHAFHKTAFYYVGDHNSTRCLDLVSTLELKCLVNGGTPRRLSKEIISTVPRGVINVHPGVLPKYRGSCCVEWAILNDDKCGNTAHFMSEDYDAGPIIEIQEYVFPSDIDYQSIRVRMYRDGFLLLGRAAASVLRGFEPIHGKPQSEGKKWKPMQDETLRLVVEKVNGGKYAHATAPAAMLPGYGRQTGPR